MKIKFVLIAAFILALSISALAQVQIVPNKVTYKRVGKDVPDFKKTFDVTYPVVLGLEDYKAEENIIKTLNYWKNFEGSLEENLGSYHWLTDLYYKVNYNKNSILDITLTMEGVGAYPDESSKNLVIDLKTGNKVYAKDTFTNLEGLAIKIGEAQKAELKKAMAEANKEAEGDGNYYLDVIGREGKFTVEKINDFSISDKGVTFLHNYDFVHAAKALEPAGRYFFTWTELKPFIKPDGLLGQFIR